MRAKASVSKCWLEQETREEEKSKVWRREELAGEMEGWSWSVKMGGARV